MKKKNLKSYTNIFLKSIEDSLKNAPENYYQIRENNCLHIGTLSLSCMHAYTLTFPSNTQPVYNNKKCVGVFLKSYNLYFFFFIFFFFGVRVSFVAFFLLVFDSNMHYSFGCCSRCSCCYCIWFSLNYERTLAHIHTHIYRYNIHNYLLVRYTSTLHYSFSLSHSRYLYLSLCLFP